MFTYFEREPGSAYELTVLMVLLVHRLAANWLHIEDFLVQRKGASPVKAWAVGMRYRAIARLEFPWPRSITRMPWLKRPSYTLGYDGPEPISSMRLVDERLQRQSRDTVEYWRLKTLRFPENEATR